MTENIPVNYEFLKEIRKFTTDVLGLASQIDTTEFNPMRLGLNFGYLFAKGNDIMVKLDPIFPPEEEEEE